MRLKGKVVIITGAGRGIGQACALRYAEEGAFVSCVDINQETAITTAKGVDEAGGRGLAIQADISTAAGNNAMVGRTVEVFGGLDLFHANAGIQFIGHLDQTPEEEWDRVHSVNLRGVYFGIKYALPELRRRGGGSIIITGSVLGMVGDPLLPAYGATKGGLRAMCRALAVAHGPENIRTNTICPGDVDTPLEQEYFDFQPDPELARKQVTDRYPLRRLAEPRDVANVAVFLASDEASYLNGIDIIVDGGLLAQAY